METRIIHEKQDLTYLNWSKIRNSSGPAGSFLKASSELGGRKIYYKLSNYDNLRGVVGHESVNELIVDRLLTVLGIEHLHYQLIHADIRVNERIEDVFLCASDDFKQPGEDKTALDAYSLALVDKAVQDKDPLDSKALERVLNLAATKPFSAYIAGCYYYSINDLQAAKGCFTKSAKECFRDSSAKLEEIDKKLKNGSSDNLVLGN